MREAWVSDAVVDYPCPKCRCAEFQRLVARGRTGAREWAVVVVTCQACGHESETHFTFFLGSEKSG